MAEYEMLMVTLAVLTYANFAGILLVTILDKKKYSDGNLTDT